MPTFKISNRSISSIFIAAVLVGLIATVSAAYTSIPNPGHGGDTVVVTIDSQEKTLQKAIDDRDFMSMDLETVESKDCLETNKLETLEASCPSGYSLLSCSGGPGRQNDRTQGWYITPDLDNNKCVLTIQDPKCNDDADSYKYQRVIAVCYK